jgi:hypothetical protein
MKSYSTVILFALMLLFGCSVPWGLPEPTQKSVQNEDIVGTWQLENGTMELREDNTFTITGSRSHDGKGTWFISAGQKDITLVYENQSEVISIGYVVDSTKDGFGIFGGYGGDPDHWRVLAKVE